MPKIIALLILVAACFDSTTPPARDCGEFPHHVGYVVAFEVINGVHRAVLSRADFLALVAERQAAQDWATCITGSDTESR